MNTDATAPESTGKLHYNKRLEMRVYGKNAVLALFKARPDDIIRLYVTEDELPNYRSLMKILAANKKAYHIVESDEIARVSETEHHGGICIITRRPAPIDCEEWMAWAKKQKQGVAVILENVENPHNIGAIVRTAAHFGALGVLTNRPNMAISASCFRIAEGGAESVPIVEIPEGINLVAFLKKNGFTTVATSSHTKMTNTDLYAFQPTGKVALFFGEETGGLNSDTIKESDVRLVIPGTGDVESLNVSVAAGILLSHLTPRS